MDNLPEYWTEDDAKDTALAKTFEDLSVVALRVAQRMPKPLAMVCGPITTGGLGSVPKNLERFEKAIEYVSRLPKNVFNQLMFEEYIWKISKGPNNLGGFHLLEEFYRPIFIKLSPELHFMPGWEWSSGACWERATAILLKMKIVEIGVTFDQ